MNRIQDGGRGRRVERGRSLFTAAIALAAAAAAAAPAWLVPLPPVPPPAAGVVQRTLPLLLNALLVPALDADALPLRLADPVAAAACAAATTVSVDGQPLRPGAELPDTPFELAWRAVGCRPFGRAGPVFDGTVRLIVVREDWGFSALADVSGLRIDQIDVVGALGRRHVALATPASALDDDALRLSLNAAREP